MKSKRSRNSILSGESDMKDGLVKMILYFNLYSVKISGASVKSESVLRLTSEVFLCAVSSKSAQKDIDNCFKVNSLSKKQKEFIDRIFKEAKENIFYCLDTKGNKMTKSHLKYSSGKNRAVNLMLKIIQDFKEYRRIAFMWQIDVYAVKANFSNNFFGW
jgi:hypothetical protein